MGVVGLAEKIFDRFYFEHYVLSNKGQGHATELKQLF